MAETIRTLKLYILKLEQDKWYVGITSQAVESRYSQHAKGFAGAAWTRKYKPVSVHYQEDLEHMELGRAQLREGRVTRKYMEKYGDNNVRGGDLVSTDDYVRRLGYIWPKLTWETITMIVFYNLVIIALLLDKYY